MTFHFSNYITIDGSVDNESNTYEIPSTSCSAFNPQSSPVVTTSAPFIPQSTWDVINSASFNPQSSPVVTNSAPFNPQSSPVVTNSASRYFCLNSVAK